MLTELRIRNFAIIESLALPLAPGFNVLSGETGAGKSIIVGALGLLLGERASADVIRTRRRPRDGRGRRSTSPSGRRFARCSTSTASTSTTRWSCSSARSPPGARARGSTARPVNAGHPRRGRTRAREHPRTARSADAARRRESQRRILDAFAGADADAASVARAHVELTATVREIADLTKRRADAERRADYLRHVVREIGDAKLIEGEDVRLEDEARRLENADELRALAGGLAVGARRRRRRGPPATAARSRNSCRRSNESIRRLSRLQELFDSALLRHRGAGARADRIRGVRRARSDAARGGPAPARPAVSTRRRSTAARSPKSIRAGAEARGRARSGRLRRTRSARARVARARRPRGAGLERARAHGETRGRPRSGSRAPSTRCCPTSACPTVISRSR